MVSRASTPSFVAEFELLEASPGGFHVFDTVEAMARRLANAALGRFRDRVRAAKSSADWKAARALPKGKVRQAAFDEIRERYDLTAIRLEAVVGEMRREHPDFRRWLGAHVTQKIAARVWQAIEKVLFAKSSRVRFHSSREVFSFEGKNNATFLRCHFGLGPAFSPLVQLGPATFSLAFDHANPYHLHAANCRVKYVRMLARWIRGERRHFAQLVLEGVPFHDQDKWDRHAAALTDNLLGPDYEAELANVEPPYRDRVAVDYGPSAVAVSNAVVSFERSIAGELKDKTAEIRTRQRRQDRRRRAANPENDRPDGTVRPGSKTWVESAAYQQGRAELADVFRRQAAHRKALHGALCYDILTLGSDVHVEKLSKKAWQRSRYGRQIAKHGPSAHEGMLTRKAENARGRVTLINTFQTALSQMCLCGERRKKALKERRHRCPVCGLGTEAPLPRDTFSAFLGLFTESEVVSRRGVRVILSSRLDLDAAKRHAAGHRIVSCAQPAARQAAPSAEPSRQVQTPGASASGGPWRPEPGGLGARSHASSSSQGSAKCLGQRSRAPVRKAAVVSVPGSPHLERGGFDRDRSSASS